MTQFGEFIYRVGCRMEVDRTNNQDMRKEVYKVVQRNPGRSTEEIYRILRDTVYGKFMVRGDGNTHLTIGYVAYVLYAMKEENDIIYRQRGISGNGLPAWLYYSYTPYTPDKEYDKTPRRYTRRTTDQS